MIGAAVVPQCAFRSRVHTDTEHILVVCSNESWSFRVDSNALSVGEDHVCLTSRLFSELPIAF